ncbi:MAG: UDP-N-acetylglucosamine 2-epimerase [Candidatus Omnitrophota bacterium]|jgi:UDP-hydrolysing UDP-N-acetyl-D-glucosamine 2-epimerase
MKRKICVVVTSRASYARVKSVLREVANHPGLELQLVVSASALLDRFGNAIQVIENDGFHPVARVYIIIEGENPTTMAKSTGLAIVELATVFENIKPDIVLTVADRFETMATAIAASYMNIPLAHIQGGEKSGSIDESVRHAVTKLAHLHFAATEESRERIIRMGENPAHVFLTGCPSLDILCGTDLSLESDILKKYGGVGPLLDFSKPYIVIMQHPVTTEYLSGRAQVKETLQAVYELDYQTAWLWPNVDAGSDEVSKGIRAFRENKNPSQIHFFKNFPPESYARLINNALCLAGNSSSGIREASFLGVPVVNIGTRQYGRERAENVIDVGYDANEIKKAIRKQIEHGKYPQSNLYGDGKAGKRIVAFLADSKINIQKKLAY